MRRTALPLLLLLAAGLAGPTSPAHAEHAAPDPDPLDAPEVRGAVEDALGWLEARVLQDRHVCEHGHGPGGPRCTDLDTATFVAEMVAAGRLDVRAWPSEGPPLHDTLVVPDNARAGQKHPDDPTRELYGATHTGYDPRDHHGRDLWAQARDAVDAVVGSGHSGYLSFLLMTLTDDPDGADEADRVADALRGVQWNCSAAPSSDCISFAVTALAHHGSLDDVTARRALAELATYRTSDGGYRGMATDAGSNTNSAAWALMTHRAAGRGTDPDTLDYLLGMQAPDGSFYWTPDDRDRDDRTSNLVATTDALVALAGGHPLPAHRPPDLPATVSVGVPAPLDLGPAYDDGTWTFPDATLHGARVTHTLPHLGAHTFHLAALGDVHQYRGPATLHATNAAPAVTLPATLDADRLAPLALDPDVTDPDGHATTATYRLGDRSGPLPTDVDLRGLRPGDHPLQVTARDGWGGTTVATALLTLRNLPPVIDAVAVPATVEAGRPFDASLEGHDPDGSDPEATWTLRRDGTQQSGATATWSLPTGHHVLVATLRDADGATVSSRHTVRVVQGPPPPEPAPAITDLDATVNATHLRIDAAVEPPGATLRLEWTLDGDTYARDAVTLPRTEPLPVGARRVEAVHLTATTTGGEAEAEAGPLPVPSPQPPDPAPERGDPPRVADLRLRVEDGTLTVNATVSPRDARIDLTVSTDGAEAVHLDVTLPHAQAIDPAAREVRIALTATTRDGVATTEAGPVRLAPPPDPPRTDRGSASLTTSTPAAPLPLAFLTVAVLAALRRRP